MSWCYPGIEDRRFLDAFEGTTVNPTGAAAKLLLSASVAHPSIHPPGNSPSHMKNMVAISGTNKTFVGLLPRTRYFCSCISSSSLIGIIPVAVMKCTYASGSIRERIYTFAYVHADYIGRISYKELFESKSPDGDLKWMMKENWISDCAQHGCEPGSSARSHAGFLCVYEPETQPQSS